MNSSVSPDAAVDKDAEQLKALGYSSNFDRSMSLWQNFALGFTYLSPVVGVYTLFGLCLAAGGPPMFWSYLLVGIGQMLVCLVFCEVVSQYPISGGVYPWARRLVGKKWAWMVGWVYAISLCVTVAAVALGAGPFIASLLGFESSPATNTLVALALTAIATLLNLSGTKLLARVAIFGFVCELVGALVIGTYLLVFERHQSFGVLFDTFDIAIDGAYWPAFLTAALAGMFLYYGFEACGDVAEETPNPSRKVPKAMRMTIWIGGAASMFAALALILAVPDIRAVISGADADPLSTIFGSAFGPLGSRIVMAVITVSFVSCVLSLQASASRLLYAYARDEMMIGSGLLKRLSPNTHVPTAALVVCGVIPALIVCVGFYLQNAIALVVSFAAVGIYLAFQMIVGGALYARLRGWKPKGKFTLGAWAWPVNIAALVYGVLAMVNMSWPRTPDAPWYVNYSILVVGLTVIAVGLVYMLLFRPHERSNAPASDAWKN
ncbi:APC family permease [Pseudomonas alkylphenolica]|uniref:APC family permease n=1 Tax=Pseudomonas alkylphenolica TaxID=237609 RepID=UPI0018D9841A|nr:amino acid permease [Pseudomonas alkylphenolica]MBH3429943.1 amino acid permease [Pseudomonas alkylphenolica]